LAKYPYFNDFLNPLFTFVLMLSPYSILHRFGLPDYNIQLGPISEALRHLPPATQVFVLTDENTRRHCLEPFRQMMEQQAWVGTSINPGEAYKTLQSAAQIWESMLHARLDRQALVINLGGGVIGDLGGFCAATWKRGIPFIQVPTTLLAMTDAAIGGKLGLDFQGIKNTIGVFQNPQAVWVDPFFLKTLPERELRSGLAEVIKHAFIGAPPLLAHLAEWDHQNTDTNSWTAILQLSIAVKVRVVQEDPLEKGLRMVLNFGHTIGHALESHFLETDTPLTHGEAVAIGMVCESFIAQAQYEPVRRLVNRFFPKVRIPLSLISKLWASMQQDKKNKGGQVRMAIPTDGVFGMRVMEISEDDLVRALDAWNNT
jgi:3-dehydroquinate synthase